MLHHKLVAELRFGQFLELLEAVKHRSGLRIRAGARVMQ
jgi:hypothetical protein